MKPLQTEHRILVVPDEIFLCPRCKGGLVKELGDRPYCYRCGGLDPGDEAIRYVRIEHEA